MYIQLGPRTPHYTNMTRIRAWVMNVEDKPPLPLGVFPPGGALVLPKKKPQEHAHTVGQTTARNSEQISEKPTARDLNSKKRALEVSELEHEHKKALKIRRMEEYFDTCEAEMN